MTTLLPHQVSIREALLRTWIEHPDKGFVIAAAVGMGKTIVSLLSLLEMYAIRGHPFRALIVVPTVVLDQWKHEWVHKLNLPAEMLHEYHGPARIMNQSSMITITTHGILQAEYRARTGDLFSTDWDVLMVDEAHLLGNGQMADLARRPLYEAIYKQVCRAFTILLTATPYTNARHNIVSLLSLINVDDVSAFSSFSIQLSHRDMSNTDLFPTSTYQLHPLVHPGNVRSIVTGHMCRYRKINHQVRSYRQRNIPVPMALLASLQTVTTRLRFLDDTSVGSKTETDMLQAIEIRQIPKVQWLLSHVDEIRTHPNPINRRVVVVSEFSSVLRMLKRVLDDHVITNALYTGDTIRTKRTAIQQSFGAATDASVLLLSKSAGGIGLSLEAGSIVLYEPHFNYAKDAQTIGRVQRLGQTHTVQVHFLCMTDGMDQKLRSTQLKKVHESRTYNPDYKHIMDNIFPGEEYQEDEDEGDEYEDVPWRKRTLEMIRYEVGGHSSEDEDYAERVHRRHILKKSRTKT